MAASVVCPHCGKDVPLPVPDVDALKGSAAGEVLPEAAVTPAQLAVVLANATSGNPANITFVHPRRPSKDKP